MKTVEIVETFDGYPNGKDERRFTKGEEPELSVAYADLLIDKGLAREATTKHPAKAAEKKDDAK